MGQLLTLNEAIMKDPTPEALKAFWADKLPHQPYNEKIALAAVHKARLHWKKATPKMREESARWLQEHGVSPLIDASGAPNFLS